MVKAYLNECIELHRQITMNSALILTIENIADICVATYKRGQKILICGNGGSASDAMHMVGELVGRFKKERRGIPAIALNENPIVITALSNDYDYNLVFQKQVVAYGEKGDILLGLSTSGNSENIISAMNQAKKQGLTTIGLTGKTGGRLLGICDHVLCVPSSDTAHIQEIHICVIHLLCKIIEENLF